MPKKNNKKTVTSGENMQLFLTQSCPYKFIEQNKAARPAAGHSNMEGVWLLDFQTSAECLQKNENFIDISKNKW